MHVTILYSTGILRFFVTELHKHSSHYFRTFTFSIPVNSIAYLP